MELDLEAMAERVKDSRERWRAASARLRSLREAVEVAPNLFVGDYGDYLDWGAFVVSATKTAHVATLGYAPDPDDPNYLSWACPSRLTINWVDGPARLYACGGVALFTQALDFIEANVSRGKTLIHCDEGMSRLPTLAPVYLAKRGPLDLRLLVRPARYLHRQFDLSGNEMDDMLSVAEEMHWVLVATTPRRAARAV